MKKINLPKLTPELSLWMVNYSDFPPWPQPKPTVTNLTSNEKCLYSLIKFFIPAEYIKKYIYELGCPSQTQAFSRACHFFLQSANPPHPLQFVFPSFPRRLSWSSSCSLNISGVPGLDLFGPFFFWRSDYMTNPMPFKSLFFKQICHTCDYDLRRSPPIFQFDVI